MKITQQKIKQCRQCYIYGVTTGIYVPVSKKTFIKALNDLDDMIVDDWGNSRLRFHQDGDVQLDL